MARVSHAAAAAHKVSDQSLYLPGEWMSSITEVFLVIIFLGTVGVLSRAMRSRPRLEVKKRGHTINNLRVPSLPLKEVRNCKVVDSCPPTPTTDCGSDYVEAEWDEVASRIGRVFSDFSEHGVSDDEEEDMLGEGLLDDEVAPYDPREWDDVAMRMSSVLHGSAS